MPPNILTISPLQAIGNAPAIAEWPKPVGDGASSATEEFAKNLAW
jgi:hypothetical protein